MIMRVNKSTNITTTTMGRHGHFIALVLLALDFASHVLILLVAFES